VTNFATPPPKLDKRSSKADQYSITHKSHPGADYPESYTITANLGDDLQITLDVKRPAGVPGFKVGSGPKGGFSYFGPDVANPEGYVVHRFWPRTEGQGMIVLNGKMIEAKGPGMFVHAIQGMRPNLVAARWNFAHFQSEEHGGSSAIQMEFTTTNDYGKKGAGSGFVSVNVGSLVLGGKLAAVTAETKWPGEAQDDKAEVISRALHARTSLDPDTGYDAPTELTFRWVAPSILEDKSSPVDATLTLDVGPPDESKGLIEKVDVLAEIPYVIKTMVNYVARTKPYIYQVRCFPEFLILSAQLMSLAPVVDKPGVDICDGPRLPDPWALGGLEHQGYIVQRGDLYLVDCCLLFCPNVLHGNGMIQLRYSLTTQHNSFFSV
jgi:hypothetical protein